MPKRSILQDPEAVKKAVANAYSIKEALNNLGLRCAGGNYKSLRLACKKFEIEVPLCDFSRNPKINKFSKYDDSVVFVKNSNYLNRQLLKQRLIKNNDVKNECSICGLPPEWNKKPLTLTLDHINGVFNDNRKENLRILCPNCHTQTDTFAGRNADKKTSIKLNPTYTYVYRTFSEKDNISVEIFNDTKFSSGRPNWSEIGRKLNISDNAAKKRIRRVASLILLYMNPNLEDYLVIQKHKLARGPRFERGLKDSKSFLLADYNIPE
jgi:hypothetical protein